VGSISCKIADLVPVARVDDPLLLTGIPTLLEAPTILFLLRLESILVIDRSGDDIPVDFLFFIFFGFTWPPSSSASLFITTLLPKEFVIEGRLSSNFLLTLSVTDAMSEAPSLRLLFMDSLLADLLVVDMASGCIDRTVQLPDSLAANGNSSSSMDSLLSCSSKAMPDSLPFAAAAETESLTAVAGKLGDFLVGDLD